MYWLPIAKFVRRVRFLALICISILANPQPVSHSFTDSGPNHRFLNSSIPLNPPTREQNFLFRGKKTNTMWPKHNEHTKNSTTILTVTHIMKTRTRELHINLIIYFSIDIYSNYIKLEAKKIINYKCYLQNITDCLRVGCL